MGWSLLDILRGLLWLTLAGAGAALVLGATESRPLLRRLGLWVAVGAALTAIGLHLDASRKLEADAAERERMAVWPLGKGQTVEEIGYIQQIRRVDRVWEHTRKIYWYVKIPVTNQRVWASLRQCSRRGV